MNIPTPSQIKRPSSKQDLASSVVPVSKESPSSEPKKPSKGPSSKSGAPKKTETVRPPLKPVKGHVVVFEKQKKGPDVGVCSCGDIRSVIYTDLVRHLKDLNIPKEPAERKPRPKSERAARLSDRPLQEHQGLWGLYNSLQEGPKGQGKKPDA